MGHARSATSWRRWSDATARAGWSATLPRFSAAWPRRAWCSMDRKPLWLLAELTYKCPLQCPYCSNPLDFAGPRFKRELSTAEWCRVFREAKALGVLQLGLSGGEPTLRPDLEELVRTAHGLGLYTSLITSAYRLSQERLAGLKAAGLDHVQISVQGAEADLSDEIAGSASYRDKIPAYHYTRELGFTLTLNVVLHPRHLHQVEALIRLPEPLGAERNVRAAAVDWSWGPSEAFNRFRGESWMAGPGRSCPRKAQDFGGCRCQAFLVAGDAGVTDPVCSLSPHRHLIDAALADEHESEEWTYRAAPASRALSAALRERA